ncbi:MAG TPA: hypothetical protein VIJ42_04710 [Stellaceae bacterium]
MTIAKKISPGFVGRFGARRAILALASVASLLALGACGYSDDVQGVLSSITGDDSGGGTPAAIAEAHPATPAAPAPVAAPFATAADSGTPVGQMRADLQRLAANINRREAELLRIRGALSSDASAYFTLIGAINSRLQLGTTPGAPDLVAQLGRARGLLDRLNGAVAALNALQAQVASDRALATYAIEEIKAGYTPGADRKQLDPLAAQANSDAALIRQLTQAIAGDEARQARYLTNERRNLAALSAGVKNGEMYSQTAAATPARAAPASSQTETQTAAAPAATMSPIDTAASPPRAAAPTVAGRRPLVTIRFDRPDVPFEQALYTAISRALDRRPDALFDLVTVSPAAGNAGQVTVNADRAKRNAENVMRSLARMGLPANRLALSAVTSPTVRNGEVQIFVH